MSIKLAIIVVLVLIAVSVHLSDLLRAAARRAAAGAPDRERIEVPTRLLDLVLADFASGEAARIERATSVLRHQVGPLAVPHLVALLRHGDPDVAQRAACLIYERQDPDAMEHLYRFVAERTAA
jgi:hypothetical protein